MTIRKTFSALAATVALAGCAAGHISASYGALCAFHAWRAVHDVRTHHSVWAAFQTWRVAHDCPRAVH